MGLRPECTVETFNARGQGYFPAYVGVQVVEVAEGLVRAQFTVAPHHLAPNGFLHAASVVALADTSAGYACLAHLPPGAESFTTLELKANFVSSVREGVVVCEARAVHLGRTTQLWEARVTVQATGRLMATFACTQLVLMPREA